MRLINAKTLELEDFRDDKVPLCAILSHTWEDDEVTFEEMQAQSVAEAKKGYRKISYACQAAAARLLTHVWVDTCCIDKRSSTELQEAINSMFRYYSDARICFVYLADVSGGCPCLRAENVNDYVAWRHVFQTSRWFTRGWTLQELLAPLEVKFYGNEWNLIGTKYELVEVISKATGIEPPVLTHTLSISSVSVARRMSWPAHRKTSRLEDQAYCLLGIFKVNMPMLYGEGEKAFIRLQEEIIKSSTDHSIFAWEFDENSQADGRLLAESPANFAHCHKIVQWALRLRDYGGGEEYHAMEGKVPPQCNLASRKKVRPRSRLSFVLEQDMVGKELKMLQITREFEPEASKIKFWIPGLSLESTAFQVLQAYPFRSWDMNDGIMHAEDSQKVRGGVWILTSAGDEYAVAFGFDLVPIDGVDKLQGRYLFGIWGAQRSHIENLQSFVNKTKSTCDHVLDICQQGRCPNMPTYLTVYPFPGKEKLEAQIHQATIMTETIFVVTFRIAEVYELETHENYVQLDVVRSRADENADMKSQTGEERAFNPVRSPDVRWNSKHELADRRSSPVLAHQPTKELESLYRSSNDVPFGRSETALVFGERDELLVDHQASTQEDCALDTDEATIEATEVDEEPTAQKMAMAQYFSGDHNWNVQFRDDTFSYTNVLND